MYKNKVSWYKLKNPDKFIKPHDSYMKSFNESEQKILAKSNLELKAFKYCDNNPNIVTYSIEPFAISYIKPTDNNVHRYYPDLLIKFKSGSIFLVEIKSSGEVNKPKKPKKITAKSEINYKKALITYSINKAKWTEASKFAEARGIKFIFLTEKELN